MALLFDLFGFLEVVVRFASLIGQAFAVGGVVFVLLLIRPAARRPEGAALLDRALRLVRISAATLVVSVAIDLWMKLVMLEAVNGVPFIDGIGAGFARGLSVRLAAAILLLLFARAPFGLARAIGASVAATALILGAAATSHAVSRPDGRDLLIVANALHQAAACVWIGGIPYLLMALKGATAADARYYGRGASVLSMIGVAGLIFAGTAMALTYVGSWSGFYGHAYGLMLGTKLCFFIGLLGLGAFNYRTVERLRRDPATPTNRLVARAQAEIGIGITIFAVAASLTSIAPAIDQPGEHVPLSAIVERLTPQAPGLTSPDHDDLAIPMLQAQLDASRSAEDTSDKPKAFVCGSGDLPPINAADIAWSEYNHHWAGLFVLLIGLMAVLERTGRASWARWWPLVFIGLAAFLFVRSDPEAWPLGQIGFWESMRDAGVFQHRLVVLLVVAFAVFETMVRTGRIKNPRAAYVFPILIAIGGGLLLLHSHPLSDVKSSFLIEMTHSPMAVLGVAAGWARFLELRTKSATAAWTWPVCFVLIGLVLLDYREA
ncbi:MAG: copper resistance protein [Rhodospirillales bacterium]|nr:copper resistance protein [Rhodospirillales bacterium]